MRQVLQPIDGGKLEIVEVPTPTCPPGYVLIRNVASAISPGTERYIRELASMSLIAKARSRPDHVRRVVEKVRQEGIPETIRQVRAKLDQPIPLGYSSAGLVVEVGADVANFRVGDRVVSNGAHAEYVLVPQNLVAKLPDEVGFDSGCFAVLASIALQGVRLAQCGIGDRVVVLGLGLIGQLAVQIANSAGSEVLAFDFNSHRVKLASKFSRVTESEVAALVAAVNIHTGGNGADAVLICAASNDNRAIELAAELVRKKGKIVCVGAVGLDLPRKPFFDKEVEFVVSCSYGPGRYDPNYEDRGHDYPYAYVRWTEQRNLAAVVEMMASSRLQTHGLVSLRVSFSDAVRAYERLEQDADCLAVVIDYPGSDTPTVGSKTVALLSSTSARPASGSGGEVQTAFVGAGSFGSGTLIPEFLKSELFAPNTLVTTTGFKTAKFARKLRFANHSTDVASVLRDEQVQAVVISTRHGDHAQQVLQALNMGKHVFVEKPLAINLDELRLIREFWECNQRNPNVPALMIGFNRRYSPPAAVLKQALSRSAGPRVISIRMNVGAIPANHWVHDPGEGGGRIIGEACHAIDLAVCLAGGRIQRLSAVGPTSATEDDAIINLDFGERGVATIIYTASGDRAGGKERVEVFCSGIFGIIDNFRAVEVFKSGKRQSKERYWSQKKGYAEEVAWFKRLTQDPALRAQTWQDALHVSEASILALQSLRNREVLKLE